jgi:hypothetical protein
MLQDLYVAEKGYKAYIEGAYLLQLLEARVEKAAKQTPPGGNGQSRTTPFLVDTMTASQWLGMIQAQKQNAGIPYYMNWNGRRLVINGRLYVYDDGKAGSTAPKDEWNDGVPPTYRELSKQVLQLKLNELKNSQKFSQKLRVMFEKGNADDVTASYGGMLPTLAGAMLLAEPRRNWRAWPINWMLIDFAESLTPYGSKADKHFTWDKILWHPEALNVDSGAENPSVTARVLTKKPQQGPINNAGTMGTIDYAGGLHRVGGKMPASPTGGGTVGGAAVTANLNYIQRKEVSILVRWLAARNLGWTPMHPNDPRKGGIPVLSFLPNDVYGGMTGGAKPILEKIRDDIDARITSFTKMIG